MVTLSTQVFTEQHTGINICEVLDLLLDEWKIPRNKVHLICTDNAANMLLGIDLLEVDHLSCYNHTNQLCINDSVFSQKSVEGAIKAARKIVTHFHHSAKAVQNLKTIQEELGKPVKKLVQDVSTRWNSTLHCLESVNE